MADDLFSGAAGEARRRNAPLAARMRPVTLDGFVGQEDVVGPGTVLREAIENDTLSSLLLYGPAGTGKTTLARIVANTTRSGFAEISAVSSGVADIRRVIEEASDRLTFSGQRTILFVDEIHRFSKSQQDALLHAVEDRLVVLVGATTENPFFEVNAPLISRSRIVELHALSDDDIDLIVDRALEAEAGLAGAVELDPAAREHIVRTSGGDARVALTTLELAAETVLARGEDSVGLDDVASATHRRPVRYDKGGDIHYDVISAFIKSMRGGDPDAAVYWLARMIHAGEDPKFIARRIMILASEDIGNADPQALLVADAAVRATEFIGLPECRINLAQAAVYMALAPKSNASYMAIEAALADVERGPSTEVPNHLRDRSYPGARELGRGDGYVYPHDHPEHAPAQGYLPEGVTDRRYYSPGDRGWEARMYPMRPKAGSDGTGETSGTPAQPAGAEDSEPADV